MNKFTKIISKIGKGAILFFGVFWTFIDFITTVAYDEVVGLFYSTAGSEAGEQFIGEGVGYGPGISDELIANVFNLFFNQSFFSIMITIKIVLSLIGVIMLTRKRSVVSFVGIFVSLALPKERIYWGSIIDSESSIKVPFAAIDLLDSQGNIVDRTISDSDGRYRFLLDSWDEHYKMRVIASGFTPSEVNVTNEFNEAGRFEITQDILVVQETQTSSKKQKRVKIHLSPLFFDVLYFLIFATGLVGFLLFVVYSYVYWNDSYGYVTVFTYGIGVFWNIPLIKSRLFNKKGSVVDSVSKKAIKDAYVVLYGDKGEVVDVKLSDKNGLVQFKLKKGEYKCKVNKVGYKFESKKLYEVKITNAGYLKDNIKLIKIEDSKVTGDNKSKSEPSTDSPFG